MQSDLSEGFFFSPKKNIKTWEKIRMWKEDNPNKWRDKRCKFIAVGPWAQSC